ncbi:MAG: hypothetical protein Rubg2KO_00350 [Rubricoccaceae bacterium]
MVPIEQAQISWPMRVAVLALIGLVSTAVAQPIQPTVDEREAAWYEARDGGLFLGCSLACAIGWRTTASSTLPASGANTYTTDNLGDGTATTAWVEGVDGNGIGERLHLNIQTVEMGGSISFRGITLVNGYAKSADLWRKNGRVRSFRLWVDGEAHHTLDLADVMRPQSFDFDLRVRSGSLIELEILDVYPGSRYEDTAISELVLSGAH